MGNENDKDTNREKTGWNGLHAPDEILRYVSPELLQNVYFIFKYKEVKAGKSLCIRARQQ
jgi:hypothetical protein